MSGSARGTPCTARPACTGCTGADRTQAEPIFVPVFFLIVNSSMAPVGQTSVQSAHWNSQYPIRGTRIGVQMDSSPPSSKACWRPLVGHAFMHSPHLTHLARNSGSGNAPGGRISVSEFRSEAETAKSGTAASPSADVRTSPRRDRSIAGA